MAMTIEQQRALAMAQAKAMAAQQGGSSPAEAVPSAMPDNEIERLRTMLLDRTGTPEEQAQARKALAAVDAPADRYALGDTEVQPASGASMYSRTGSKPVDQTLAALTSGVNAVPLLGPLAEKGVTNAQSAVFNALYPDADVPSKPEDFSTAMRARETDNPAATTIGKVAGNTLPFVAAGGVPILARGMGMVGGLPSRIAAGGVSSAGLMGSDALVRGEGMDAALNKAKWAGGAGALTPVAERLLGGLFSLGKGGVSKDASNVARAIKDDKIPVSEIPSRLEALGSDAMLMDLGPNLQSQAGALASVPGPGQEAVRASVAQRAAGTNSRIMGDVNDTLGPAPVPSQVEGTIAANRDALGPQYADVFRAKSLSQDYEFDPKYLGSEVDRVLADSVGGTQGAVDRVRKMLLDPQSGKFTQDPSRVFAVRNELDGMIGAETNGATRGKLIDLRKTLDGELGAQVPGLKQVDAKYEELQRQSTALQTGQQTLDSGRTAMRPEELADQMTTAAVPERGIGPSAVPFRLTQGNRAEVERIIGTTANDLNALKTALKGDGSWNRDRLVTLYGQEKADKLLGILDREKTYDATARTVTSNSETARRQASQGEVNPESGVAPKTGATLTGLTLSALDKLRLSLSGMAKNGVNAGMGDFLTATSAALSPSQLRQLEQVIQSGGRGILPPVAAALLEEKYRPQIQGMLGRR